MIEKAIKLLGIPGLARAVGVSRQAVMKWRKNPIRAERCLQIEKATKGAVTRYDLRPDLFGRKPSKRAA